jgi:hypothetical protein
MFDWIEYLFPAGIRKAWCELTGGHDSEILCAWAGNEGRATHVRLHCFKCGRETRWFPVKSRPTTDAPADGER